MALTIVCLITSDPRTSHKPAEALRIATGLGTGGGAIKIILMGPAAAVLLHDASDIELTDAETIERYLPILKEWEFMFYVERDSVEVGALDEVDYPATLVTRPEIATMLAETDRFLAF